MLCEAAPRELMELRELMEPRQVVDQVVDAHVELKLKNRFSLNICSSN